MTASPTRRQLVFLLGSLLLAPLVTLYATQAVWLQSLWAPLPWMASHGGATVLFWVLFSSLSLTLYGFFRRLFPAYLPEVAVFMGVAVTSRYKLDINGAPLQLSDFAFVGNLGDITGYAASQLIPTLTTLLAIGVAVGVYFGLKPLIGAAEVGWVCMLAAFPFAMCGFLPTTACPPSASCWRSSARKSSARERLHIIHRICTRSFYWTAVQCGRC